MKIKYYLRGLATGLVIAAVLMSFTSSGSRSISDEEIKERAMRLGMVMGGNATLSDGRKPQQTESGGESEETGENMQSEGTEDSRDPAQPPENKESGESQESEDAVDGMGTEESGGDGETEDSRDPAQSLENEGNGETQNGGEPDENQNPGNGQDIGDAAGSVTVVIYSGYGSNDVARAMKNAGLVENAEDFDEFLCANGYDKRICVDVYRIPMGSSYEEIAWIITKRG